MKIIKLLLHVTLFSTLLYASQLLLSEVLVMYKNDTLKTSIPALKVLENEALHGNTNAAFLLASAYKNAKLGEADISKAMYWYKVSANSGDADAMLMLGWLYYQGSAKVDMNSKKARYWFKKAASSGVDEAIEMLELLRKQ